MFSQRQCDFDNIKFALVFFLLVVSGMNTKMNQIQFFRDAIEKDVTIALTLFLFNTFGAFDALMDMFLQYL